MSSIAYRTIEIPSTNKNGKTAVTGFNGETCGMHCNVTTNKK